MSLFELRNAFPKWWRGVWWWLAFSTTILWPRRPGENKIMKISWHFINRLVLQGCTSSARNLSQPWIYVENPNSQEGFLHIEEMFWHISGSRHELTCLQWQLCFETYSAIWASFMKVGICSNLSFTFPAHETSKYLYPWSSLLFSSPFIANKVFWKGRK